jgi:hypothetical protein
MTEGDHSAVEQHDQRHEIEESNLCPRTNVQLKSRAEFTFRLVKRGENDRELGADHFDRINVKHIHCSRVRRLERLGHSVTLEPLA